MNHADRPTFLDLYRSAGPYPPGWRLELGVGTRPLARADGNQRWICLDLRRKPLRQASGGMGQTNRHAFHQGDAQQLPYRAGAFAAVLGNSLLHHVARPEQVLSNALRVLAPGGFILFRGPLPGMAALSATRLRLPDEREIQQMVANLGLSDTKVTRLGRHWVWLARKPE